MKEPHEPSPSLPPAANPGGQSQAGPPADLAAVGDFRQMMWRLRLKRWAPLAVASAISLLVGILIGTSLSGGSSSAAASDKPCPEAQVVEAGSAPADDSSQRPRTRSRRGGEAEPSSSGSGSGHF